MNNTTNLHCYTILSFFTSITLIPIFAIASNSITATKPLTIHQTIVSAGEDFELGFFNSSNTNWYVGIWYKKVPTKTIVWVANRDNPLTNPPGVLKIGENGNLLLVDNLSNTIWSSNQSKEVNTVAQLLDLGNFVLRREDDLNSENYLWQSFDYPTDTLLPDMKLGWDRETGLNRYLTSWKNQDDPSSGDYTFKLNINGFPEIFLMNKDVRKYRSGPWNGLRFSGVPEMDNLDILTFSFVMQQDEVYYSYHALNNSVYSRLLVNPLGVLQRFTWIGIRNVWNPYWYAPKDQCDNYKECGGYGICDTNASPVCKCVLGFEPRNKEAWNLRDGSDGCVRRSKLDCGSDGFLGLKNVKLPESSSSFVDKMISIGNCERICRRNCSCMAYASSNISGGGSGCVIWSGELMDMRQYLDREGGQDLFVRVAASDLAYSLVDIDLNIEKAFRFENWERNWKTMVTSIGREEAGSVGSQNGSKRGKKVEIVGITVGISIVLSGLIICFVWKRKMVLQSARKDRIGHRGPLERSQDFLLKEGVIQSKRDNSSENARDDQLIELPLLDFSTIVIATNNFSDENKVGQGGFGCVYKGVLVEGQIIAVKRLSKNSGQGIEEFKNEVTLIARLQHRNLVRLLGCCVDMEEKMLIYEYLENRSLDTMLFDQEKSSLLNWQRRFNIICGIARGLLYLHQDSRFRIIHRDLKASNILLDKEMNPKISDFGMARIFGGDQIEANTKRVVGTYGYMSPEYAMDGLFSVKSDVFSFGVLVLEIVSGKKNRGFYYTNNQLNLLGHVWKLWREGKGLEIMDISAGGSYSIDEVLRCIQVGLLCVQEQAEERPTMSTVLLMLSSENATLPQPKHPGFCLGRRPAESDSSSSKQDESHTSNQLTVTMLDGR
ncbi:hypothetical protein LguiB_005071 [Lonicera macranthoides]